MFDATTSNKQANSTLEEDWNPQSDSPSLQPDPSEAGPPDSSCFHCKGAYTHITVKSIKNTLQGIDDGVMILRFKEYRARRLRHSRFV